ncbi:hypothetical protein [Isoptericola variabilis]|uniref:Uncharacterized protein n=1 Tax=Isoptericola variabilis (strain 225) TaxID=743718 RepID=F6FRB2_ISOV2|nr:hypothetical protein [Isoptericola variabilis]AEG42972.1 hypothetical protein Isova_0162 [Isoptericola variabilis 225]
MRDVEFAPLLGVPLRLERVGAAAAHAAAVLEDARASTGSVGGRLEGQRSVAVTTARARLSDVGTWLGMCAGVLAEAATTLRRHAAVLADLQQAALLAISRRDDALERERRAQAELEEARRSTWNALGQDLAATALRIPAAERAMAEARADVLAAEAQWRRARDAKAAESVRAATALSALGDVRLVTASVAAGMRVPQVTASWERGLHAASLAATAAWNGSSRDRSAASAELRRLLAEVGRDPAFWTAFWDQVTPEELYRAVGIRPVEPSLAEGLADGVRLWAAGASEAELETFGRALVEDLGDHELGLDARAALAALLLAPALPGAVHRSAAEALVERRTSRPGDPVDVVRLEPLITAVATGLLLRPHEAFEHLAPADDALAAERARAWFGVAPPGGWPDGGAAVAGALAAAVLHGSGSSSRSDQARAATLVSHATHELPRGLLSEPPPSDLASVRIVRAYEPYVPVFGDAVRSADKNGPPRPAGVVDDFTLADGVVEDLPVVVQPDLDAFALRDVISATSRTEAGAGAWLGSADRYHDAMLDLAFGTSAPEGISEGDQGNIVRESLRDAASVAGALQLETIRTAQREQAVIDGAASGAVFLANVAIAKVPMPPVASTSTSTATGTVIDGFVPDRLGPAREAVLEKEAQLRQHYVGRAYAAAVDHDVDHGMTYAEAVDERTELAPGSGDVSDAFGSTYNAMSDLRRELGENP